MLFAGKHKHHSRHISLQEDTIKTKAADYSAVAFAAYQNASGNSGRALEHLRPLLTKNHPAQLYELFINTLFHNGNFHEITALVERKKEIFSKKLRKKLSLNLLIAQSYLMTGNTQKAEEILEGLAEQYPNNQKLAYTIATFLIKQEKFDEALTRLNTYLENKKLSSKHFLFHFLKAKIYEHKHEIKEALKEVKKSITILPSFERGWMLRAVLAERLSKNKEAISYYQKALSLGEPNPLIEQHVFNLMLKENAVDQAASYLRNLKEKKANHYFILADLDHKAHRHEQALENINHALEKIPSFIKAKVLKAEILLDHHDDKQALAFMESWLHSAHLPKDYHVALKTILNLDKKNIPLDSIISVLEKEKNRGKNNLALQAGIVDLYKKTHNYSQAQALYHAMLKSAKNKVIRSHITAELAHLYYQQKEFSAMEELLNKAFALNEGCPSAYNLLACHYINSSKKFTDALKLTEKALDCYPSHPAYLDTKGLSLMKLKKRDEAIETFKNALKLAENDQIILEHLNQALSAAEQ